MQNCDIKNIGVKSKVKYKVMKTVELAIALVLSISKKDKKKIPLEIKRVD